MGVCNFICFARLISYIVRCSGLAYVHLWAQRYEFPVHDFLPQVFEQNDHMSEEVAAKESLTQTNRVHVTEGLGGTDVCEALEIYR